MGSGEFKNAGLLFITSLVICLIPLFFVKVKAIKRFYPFLTVFSAGFLLGVMLLSFIPHTLGVCPMSHSHNDHGDEEGAEEKHSHSSSKHDHKNHGSFSNLGLTISGIAFIFLIAVDSLILNHSHCDGKSEPHDHSGHSHDAIGTCNTDAIKSSTNVVQAMIYVLAISVHSFFEGLGIKKGSGTLFWGIFMHKAIESFSLGFTISCAKALKFYSMIFICTVYSSLTPLGMLLVNNLPDSLKNNSLIVQICNGLSLGSTMFIVCFEMIPPIFHTKMKFREDMFKVVLLALGYFVTYFIQMNFFAKISSN
ncbi:hypothetical protein EDEG_03233 [Edhazardia aedis USNM 41457]|uniref:ZIP zinc/iron transporter n=1 Tax=Edhazardia aedis (strain USNM 41457) TaxID=1003232 RepID=J9D3B0_EDHAE|nr:hypothetical protein EDEG_03233 [Edhazardia aedis USNM 41457]|eukprot:EJW02331.1 hypothetical protein EDEG_03233 [Edhazardia aedis USNM 41457]